MDMAADDVDVPYGPPRPRVAIAVNPNFLVKPPGFVVDEDPSEQEVAQIRDVMKRYIDMGRFDWLADCMMNTAFVRPHLWLKVAIAEHDDRMKAAKKRMQDLWRGTIRLANMRRAKFNKIRKARKTREGLRMRRLKVPRVIPLPNL